jgi:hypothetical protein
MLIDCTSDSATSNGVGAAEIDRARQEAIIENFIVMLAGESK